LKRASDALIVLGAMVLVAWHLRPDLFLAPTITTGGDTASHYYTAWWLRYRLLPTGHVTGWLPGNYAGFPLFQVYFPLPFILMAAVSLVTGLPVAFKLVSVAGLIGLPPAAYACFRLLKFRWPAPALAAAFTVPFLFHEADSVWGANITSTLAGEFTYSFGTALLLIFAGTLHRGAASGRGWIGNGVLLASIGLSHAYTLLAASAFGMYLVLFHPEGRRATGYLLKVGTLAFCLIAFWAMPLVAYSEYTTGYAIIWPIDGFTHVFPVILWPFIGTAVGGAALAAWVRRRRPDGALGIPDGRVPYLLSLAAGAGILYLAAWKLDVVDIRFLPFVQLTLTLVAALPVAAGLRAAAARVSRYQTGAAFLLVVLAGSCTFAWSGWHVTAARNWSAWNYGGFERAPGWPAFRAVNDAVTRTWADPRVAYEHNVAHNDAGTVRAFESLPLFAGASTLEGLYMQSTISSPFVFYIQSEISEIPSCPLLPYHCGRLNAARAAEHLGLFNVSDVITRTDRVSEALDASPRFVRSADVPPYRVYHLAEATGAYVEPLRYEPLVLEGPRWKDAFFAWFKRPGSGDVPLVRAGTTSGADRGWTHVADLPARVPTVPLPEPVEVSSTLEPETIRIHTSRPGHPLLVKVSYHPRWRVEGADAVRLASPSFMLIVPTQPDVTLVYGATGLDRIATGTSAAAWLFVVVFSIGALVRRRHPPDGDETASEPHEGLGSRRDNRDGVFRYRRIWAPLVIVALVAGAMGARLSYTDPWIPHRAGLERFLDGDYVEAEPLLLDAITLAPSSTAAFYSFYYYALSAYRTANWEETIARFTHYVSTYPDGEHLGEAHLRIAEALEGLQHTDEAVAAYLETIDQFPSSPWAGFAAARLTAIAATYDERSRSSSAPTRPDHGG